MQWQQFETIFYLLPLGGCNVVMGVYWLSTLGPILWDFLKLTMSFDYNGQPILIHGLKPTEWSLMEEQNFHVHSEVERQGVVVYVVHTATENKDVTMALSIWGILQEYGDIFAKHKGLPPIRNQDHRIILKEGTLPICVRPYRYLFYQKGEIEKIILELLELGEIRRSQSPFSSLVLLVRKVDGSWRMCMDYIAQNKATVKEKYPIPMVDELRINYMKLLFYLSRTSDSVTTRFG